MPGYTVDKERVLGWLRRIEGQAGARGCGGHDAEAIVTEATDAIARLVRA
jgi:hypothetical protein